MRGTTHLPSGVSVMRGRALLQEEVYGIRASRLRLVGGASPCGGVSPIVVVASSHPEIVAGRLQTQADLMVAWLGRRLAHTSVSLHVTVCKRHRDRVGIVLNRLIQLPSLILLSCCWLRHVWNNCCHIKWRNALLGVNHFWGTYFQGRRCLTSARTFFLLSANSRIISMGWNNSIFRVWKNLGKLLNGRVENSLLIIVIHNVNRVQSLEITNTNRVLINAVRSRDLLVHF